MKIEVGVQVGVELDVEVGVRATPTSLLSPVYKGFSKDSVRCWIKLSNAFRNTLILLSGHSKIGGAFVTIYT